MPYVGYNGREIEDEEWDAMRRRGGQPMPLIIDGYLSLDIREIRRHVGHRLDASDGPPALACRTCEQTIATYIEPRPTYRCGACDTVTEHREGMQMQAKLRQQYRIPASSCVGCVLGDDGPSMHDCYIHRA